MDGSTYPFIGSWCSLVWERRTTCWVTMRVPDPNILAVRRPPPFREGRDLDHHVSACSEGARACGGGVEGMPGLLSVRPHFCWGGGVGAAKGLLPWFLVPKGNQPTACTLALWWLKFGPTEGRGGGGGQRRGRNGVPGAVRRAIGAGGYRGSGRLPSVANAVGVGGSGNRQPGPRKAGMGWDGMGECPTPGRHVARHTQSRWPVP